MSGTVLFTPNYTDWPNSTTFSLKQVQVSGGGGATGPTGPTGAAGAAGSNRSNANLLLQWVSGATVTADTVWFTLKAPYAGTINSMTYFCDTGSFTIAVQIAGTPVTGLGAIANNSATPATTNATAANTFTAGQAITAVISSPSGSPTDALLSLNVTWS
jgi:hypothetical protein